VQLVERQRGDEYPQKGLYREGENSTNRKEGRREDKKQRERDLDGDRGKEPKGRNKRESERMGKKVGGNKGTYLCRWWEERITLPFTLTGGNKETF